MKPPNEEYEMKRILIVEDDMALAQELQYLLISNQYDAQRVEEFTDVADRFLLRRQIWFCWILTFQK